VPDVLGFSGFIWFETSLSSAGQRRSEPGVIVEGSVRGKQHYVSLTISLYNTNVRIHATLLSRSELASYWRRCSMLLLLLHQSLKPSLSVSE